MGFLGGSVVKNLPANERDIRDMGSIPVSERSPGNPLQYSCLENSMDRGAWWATVHGAAKSWIELSIAQHIWNNDEGNTVLKWQYIVKDRYKSLIMFYKALKCSYHPDIFLNLSLQNSPLTHTALAMMASLQFYEYVTNAHVKDSTSAPPSTNMIPLPPPL